MMIHPLRDFTQAPMPSLSGWPGQLPLFSLISSFRKLLLSLCPCSAMPSFPFSLMDLWEEVEKNIHILSAMLNLKTQHIMFFFSIVRLSVSFKSFHCSQHWARLYNPTHNPQSKHLCEIYPSIIRAILICLEVFFYLFCLFVCFLVFGFFFLLTSKCDFLVVL